MRILQIEAKVSCIFWIIVGQGVFDMDDLLALLEVKMSLQFSPYSRVEMCKFATAVMSHMEFCNTYWCFYSVEILLVFSFKASIRLLINIRVKLISYLNC